MISKDSTSVLKGFAALWVIVYHLSQLTDFVINPYIHITGQMHVGLFFFLSGYGLAISLRKNKMKFFTGFWKKRSVNVLVPFIIINVIYVFAFRYFYEWHNETLFLILKYVLGLKLINPQAWYVVTQFILYVIFYISFKLATDNKNFKFVVLLFLYFLYVVYELSTGGKIFVSSVNFILGVFIVESSNQLEFIYKKYGKIVTISLGFLFLLLCIIMFNRDCLPGFTHRPIFTINSLVFTASIYSLFKVYPFINDEIVKVKFLKSIGKVSYELYLIHYLFICVIINHNDISYSLQVLIFSICTAYFIYFAISYFTLKITSEISKP